MNNSDEKYAFELYCFWLTNVSLPYLVLKGRWLMLATVFVFFFVGVLCSIFFYGSM